MQVNYNNEKNDAPQANTFGLRLPNWDTQTSLAIKYFESMAAVGIHLPSPGSQNKDYPRFDMKPTVVAYLKTTDAKTIYKKGKKAMERFEETGQFEEFGIPLKRGMIQLAQARDLKKKLKNLTGDVNPDDICVVIYANMDNDKKTEEYLVHVFNQSAVVKGYSPEDGQYSLEKTHTEVWEFLDALNEFSKAMSNGITHALKNDAKFEKRKWERLAYELATSLGVDLSKSTNTKTSKPSVNWNSGEHRGNTVSDRNSSSSDTQVINADAEEDIDTIIAQLTAGDGDEE